MPGLPRVIAAPPTCVAPLTTTRPLPAALALCPIAIALPDIIFPIELWKAAAADPAFRKYKATEA